ncbi:uncharacterized protein LOC125656629 isoform X1 [Ostrea edulis]|uniref:uncharacterized protein LOC125656629 isoform X1 n=1 Tax=Ostrea edulis TaxID=37623 RepID=UPI002094DBBD|nr:uncharacterized protein LOC125656629 isoform X1 [Ostrea edulis]
MLRVIKHPFRNLTSPIGLTKTDECQSARRLTNHRLTSIYVNSEPCPWFEESEEESSISMACQTEEPRKRSVKIQVAAKNKEKGLQVNLQPRVRSIGVQFNGRDDLPTPQVPPAAVPVLDLSSGGESIEEVGSEAASLYEPSSGCASSDDSHIHNNNNEKPYNPLDEEKFIVSRSKLLELFSSCKRCHRHATATVHQVIGTMARISAECEFCGFTWQWSSQPSLGNIPVGNLGLSASILFSGALAAKVLRVLQFMGVATITSRTFYSHQASVLFPVIARVWNRHQETYARQAVERGEPLIVGGDGRADSPGHCAKFGSYSTIDLEKGIVIDIQLVQSNEVKNSNGMEKRGLERAVDWVKNNDLEIGTIVTDRHLQIQKWIRENLPETTHYYDVWHVAKGLKKKVLAAAKQSECGQLSKWSRSLTNHLYWVAASTPNGDGDLMWAKWESVENHVHNKHEGHNELFPSCAHGMLYGDERKKKWIKPGSKASEKISDIILSNQMKRDIPKLSPLYQTSQIEAFHSTVNHFAPKMVAFSYYGMYCRLIVAALHFNENTSRVQAATKEGNMQFKISFPKFKHGEYSVRKRTVDSTYGYVTSLMTETFASMEASVDATSPHQPPVSCLPEIQPPPLCSNFVHPEKSEAVQHFRSRFRRKETPV